PFAFVVNEPSNDEADLVRGAQNRDVRAFEALYRVHVRRVYAICLRMVANVPEAEELTQRTFITVWEKLPRFRGDSAFGSWLHRVAVNTVLIALRSDQRRQRRVFTTDDVTAFETASTSPPPGNRLDLEEAITTLP